MGSTADSASREPNRQLTWYRLERGWSRRELAAQIARSMAEHNEVPTGLGEETVRKWEAGVATPGPQYRKHLVLVFDRPASKLGLLTAEELALKPESLQLAPQLCDDPTTHPAETPPERDVLPQAMMDRRHFVRRALAVGLTPLVIPDAPEILLRTVESRASRLDPAAVAAYSQVVDAQRRLYWSVPADSLLDACLAHASVGTTLLRSGGSQLITQELAGQVAQTALLAARLAFFDLNDIELSERCFALAMQAVEVTGDHALTAAIMAHRAFHPGFDGNAAPASHLLTAACGHAQRAPSPLLQSWLACVKAEIGAHTGQATESLDHISRSEDALTHTGQDPPWLDFFDSSRLDGFAGNALLAAGRHAAAEQRLDAAVTRLGPDGDKQRAVLLFDLGLAQVATDTELAAATATRALDSLEQAFYATAYERIPAMRAALASTPFGIDFEDRVQSMPIPSGWSHLRL